MDLIDNLLIPSIVAGFFLSLATNIAMLAFTALVLSGKVKGEGKVSLPLKLPSFGQKSKKKPLVIDDEKAWQLEQEEKRRF